MKVKFNSAVRFKCKQSGNVFEFFTEHDIKTMRTHPEYVEIVEEVVEQVKAVRPKKVKEEQ